MLWHLMLKGLDEPGRQDAPKTPPKTITVGTLRSSGCKFAVCADGVDGTLRGLQQEPARVCDQAWLLVGKFCNGLGQYRQQQDFCDDSITVKQDTLRAKKRRCCMPARQGSTL
jgi:hypothetical protein